MPDNHAFDHACATGKPDGRSYQELAPFLYRRLRELAAGSLRGERRNHTLQPTALANEAFLRLSRQRTDLWNDPPRFAALAARIMRRILVDHARARGRVKRGSGAERVVLTDAFLAETPDCDNVLAVSDALRKLAKLAPRAARVVELRFFAGLAHAESAVLLGVTERSIERDWRYAKAWLYRELRGDTTEARVRDAEQA